MCSVLTARCLSIDREEKNNKFHSASSAATFFFIIIHQWIDFIMLCFVMDDNELYSEVIKKFKGFARKLLT